MLAEVFGDVEANSPGPNDGDPLPNRFFIPQNIEIVHHLGVFDARNGWHTRYDAAGEDHIIEIRQILRLHLLPQLQFHFIERQLTAEIAQRLVKLLLAGDLLGDIELATDLLGGIKQGYLVPAAGGGGGKR